MATTILAYVTRRDFFSSKTSAIESSLPIRGRIALAQPKLYLGWLLHAPALRRPDRPPFLFKLIG